MSISLSGLGSTLQQQALQNANNKLQAVINSLVSGNVNSATSDAVVTPSTASQLQAQNSALKQASGNLVQALSLTQVADGGAQQVQDILSQLQGLAQDAQSPTLNQANRQQVNQQFQQLVQQIDTIASSTSFVGKKLLDGSLSGKNSLSLDAMISGDGNNSETGNTLSVADLGSQSLVGQGLDLLTAGSAGQALAALGLAQNRVTAVRTAIGSFQQSVDFAAANVDSALANQQAAQSTLSDTDFVQASTQLSLASLQFNAGIALAAQTNRLPPSMLQLIS